jgi:hypothetical protein
MHTLFTGVVDVFELNDDAGLVDEDERLRQGEQHTCVRVCVM